MSGIDESQADTGNSESSSGVFLTSLYNSQIAVGAPVSPSRPRDEWMQNFSVYIGQEGWVQLFKLRPYNVGELMTSSDTISTMNDVDGPTRDAVETALLRMFTERNDDVDSRVKNMRKYRISDDGQTAIVLSSGALHRHTKHPIVLIVGEDGGYPRPMSEALLIVEGRGRGDRLTAEEKHLLKGVLEKLLQGIPVSEVDSSHPLTVDQQQYQADVKKCHEPFKAYVSPVMAETTLTIYYRHNRRGGISGECLPCDTVEAMVQHVTENCGAQECPQRQFLAKAYAQHVMAANCGSDPSKCSIPFCGRVNHLVHPRDVQNPSPWLTSVVVRMTKLYRETQDTVPRTP